MTIRSGTPDTFVALILRGAGLGMLFTPINLAAFSSLKGIEIAQGASMLNLMRQLGGSFGIAGLSTYITRRTAEHYNNLCANAYVGNPLAEAQLRATTVSLMQKGMGPNEAHQGAIGLMYASVEVQSSTMSFNDAFLLIGLSVVLVSPLVFLLRTPKKAPGPAPEMH
jgi:DHA2 family multidrug resistance protein